MALIEQAKGRTDGNSAYIRLFGDEELGSLISKVQATVITNGTELQKLVLESLSLSQVKPTLSQLLATTDAKTVVYNPDVLGKRPDFVVYDPENNMISVIELKSGDTFDTGKSDSIASMFEIADRLAARFNIPARVIVVGFHQDNKLRLLTGFKRRLTLDQIMTGLEFAEFLSFDYDKVLQLEREDQQRNKAFFLDAMKDILNG